MAIRSFGHGADDLSIPSFGPATGSLVLPAEQGARLHVPGREFIVSAEYERAGDDLVIVGADGLRVVVSEYFTLASPPTLVSDIGAQMSPEMIATLVGPLAPGQYAQAGGGGPTAGVLIGRIEIIEGGATATRADGTVVTLVKDSSIFKGDVVRTSTDAKLGVVLVDKSTFALGENARMVMNDMVYNPAEAGQGSFLGSLLQGTFVFVTGEIAKAKPENFVVETPFATIGVRGTKVAVEVESNTVQVSQGSVGLSHKLTGLSYIVDAGFGVALPSSGATQVAPMSLGDISPALQSLDATVSQALTPFSRNPRGFNNNDPAADPAPSDADPAPSDENPVPSDVEPGAGSDGSEAGEGEQPGEAQNIDPSLSTESAFTVSGDPALSIGEPSISGDSPNFVGAPAGSGNTGNSPITFAPPETVGGDNTAPLEPVIEPDSPAPVDQIITGGDGDDTLTGGTGDDVIDGGIGADEMIGQGGNDTFIVDDAGDLVRENDGEGIDTVQSSVSFVLADNVENLILSDIEATLSLTEGDSVVSFDEQNTGSVIPLFGDGRLVNGLGGSAGFGENAVSRNDDGFAAVDVSSVFGEGLNFFGANFTQAFINTNGNVTFGSPQSNFTPFALTGATATPIIAPFFADVDTRGGDPNTATQGGNSTGENLISYDLDAENGVFTVTWDDVGFFSQDTSLQNAFQLQLFDRGSGDFDMVWRYEDINWTTGNASGGSDGLGGTVARAGWSAGNGTDFFELAASGDQASILNLENASGSGTFDTGVYRFEVRNGVVSEAPESVADPNALTGTGNDLDNIITGNSGDNILVGNGGDDTLDGGLGGDTLLGGAGDDIFVVDNVSDRVVENAGEGADEVRSSVTRELSDNVENLTLTGSGDIDGTGNDLDNRITGNGGDNVLSGGAGADTLTGNAGADTFDLGARSNGTATIVNGRITETISGPGFSFDIVTDFVAGVDRVRLGEGYDLEIIEGVDVTIEEGVNFEIIGTAYDGTNATSARFAAGQGTLILDSDGRLISDLNGSAAGYSVLAQFDGGAPESGDIDVAQAA
jgi:hypothetical protein